MTTATNSIDLNGPDRVFASSIRAIRHSLGATHARLSRASGISRQRIEAIETGVAPTHAERRDITAALARLSNHHVAKALARRRLMR
ncbi:MAG: helix-turn-helix transcriptional regulator [Dermatophilaceae bacterium]